MINKKQVLFDLRNHVKLLTADELNEVLNDDVLSIEDKKNHLIIRFSNNRDLVVWNAGTKSWRFNKQLHRENDKPAAIYADCSIEWWVNGRLHRENDQPAIIHADGLMEWWINGRRIK